MHSLAWKCYFFVISFVCRLSFEIFPRIGLYGVSSCNKFQNRSKLSLLINLLQQSQSVVNYYCVLIYTAYSAHSTHIHKRFYIPKNYNTHSMLNNSTRIRYTATLKSYKHIYMRKKNFYKSLSTQKMISLCVVSVRLCKCALIPSCLIYWHLGCWCRGVVTVNILIQFWEQNNKKSG